MMQGDSYNVPVVLTKRDKTPLLPSDVLEVEIALGSLIKTFSNGEVQYNDALERWLFPVTQEETFAFLPAKVKAQARIKLKDGSVCGVPLGTVNPLESISKEVL